MLLIGLLGEAAAGAGAAGAGAAAVAGAGAGAAARTGAAGAGAGVGAGAGGAALAGADADWTGCSVGDVPFAVVVLLCALVATPVSATSVAGRVFDLVVRGALPSGIAVLRGEVRVTGSAVVAGAAATAVPCV